MMRQKTAPVPAMSKKTRQVTVTVGGSHCWIPQSATCTLCSVPVPNISCWWEFWETVTFSTVEKAMFH